MSSVSQREQQTFAFPYDEVYNTVVVVTADVPRDGGGNSTGTVSVQDAETTMGAHAIQRE